MWNPVSIIRRWRSGERDAPRGQVLIIFASMLTILLLFSALVIDLGWLWSNTLRIQRAADAAALAGVVHLPGNATGAGGAYDTAIKEAIKNGYTNGSGGVTVTPQQDPDVPRRLDVSVQAPVKTWFLGLIGMNTVSISRKAQADYVLPVPMGSPLNYYGVGDYTTMVAGTAMDTGGKPPTGTHNPNGWTNPTLAFAQDGSSATNNTGATQGYENFGMSVPSGSVISGIEVRVRAKSSDNKGCEISVQASWDNGSNWTTKKFQLLTNSDVTSVIGAPNDGLGHGWTSAQLVDGKFLVRVTDEDRDTGDTCDDNATTSLDYLTVSAYYTTPPATQSSQVTDPFGAPLCGKPSCSQGFWGAIEGQGSSRSTGDAYATGYNPSPTKNADYDANGYDYTMELPSGGSVYIFDPTFCAMANNPAGGGHLGAGDHWLANAVPVSTYFQLWNTNGTQAKSDDTLEQSSGTLFEDEYNADLITGAGSFSDGGEPSNPTDCGSSPYHNKWWLMKNVAAGTYRLQVTTTKPGSPDANWDESFENMWSLLVQGGGKPHIYGSGRMVSYANILSGQQEFYLAQIDRASGAGKTVEIRLFDPGDVGQKAWMQILSPDGNVYKKATFDYTADNGRSGSGVTCIQTYAGGGPSAPAGCPDNTSGGTYYQNSWITINVALPSSYGSTGLKPTGETEPGWWKIRYTVNNGNDTTTWEVSIRGNPVHLVVP